MYLFFKLSIFLVFVDYLMAFQKILKSYRDGAVEEKKLKANHYNFPIFLWLLFFRMLMTKKNGIQIKPGCNFQVRLDTYINRHILESRHIRRECEMKEDCHQLSRMQSMFKPSFRQIYAFSFKTFPFSSTGLPS